jgi:hypothetical protein
LNHWKAKVRFAMVGTVETNIATAKLVSTVLGMEESEIVSDVTSTKFITKDTGYNKSIFDFEVEFDTRTDCSFPVIQVLLSNDFEVISIRGTKK